jgi:hypothetical protein
MIRSAQLSRQMPRRLAASFAFFLMLLFMGTMAPAAATAACRPGIYGPAPNEFVIIGRVAPAPRTGEIYLFRDGRRGATGDSGSPVTCENDIATVASPDGAARHWSRRDTRETDATFDSAATRLVGRLIEPPGSPDPKRPLVVLVHGSEKTSPIGSVYAYMLAAQNVSVFVYDKRGTGASGGDYTQNFELLADDASAALVQARRMAAGRFGRAGFFGGSQGGWVAPLAATRAPADFVAVGYGLVVSPIEEDREQMLDEAERMHLDAQGVAQVERLSQLTAALVRSHFERGFQPLAQFRREVANTSWAKTIDGEYSGDMLRMSDADLRRIGRARFDNLELIWDYDSAAALRKLKVPLLWVLAGEDRDAPIGETRAVLSKLIAAGRPIEVYLFPDTDHGIMEFRTNPDGTRTPTRITDGYLKLLADWIKGDVRGNYGRAQKLH